MKKIFILMLCIFTFSISKNVIAKTEILTMEYSNTPYYLRQGEGGVTTGKLTYYDLNGEVAYCVEPGTHITDSIYVELSLDNLNLPNDILDKIKLIGYYGYEYPGHGTDNYRLATQSLIWETVRNLTVIYSTERNGEGTIIDVSSEKNEIMRLVNNHLTLPNFNSDLDLSINTSNILIDSNNVLKDFEIINNNSDLEVFKDNNRLYIKSNKVGEYEITLRKIKYDNKGTYLYGGNDGISQKLMKLRYDGEVETKLKINIIGGKLHLYKLNQDTKSNQSIGSSKLINARYGIYDEFDNLIEEIVTDELGVAISNYLEFKKYYVKEIEPSYGYELDLNKYEFIINKDNLEKELEVYEELKKKNVTIIKTLEGNYGLLMGEGNITFEIYLNNSLYKIVTTDKDGIAQVKLPYGKYLIKQINTTEGYLKADDFVIEIDEKTDDLYKVIYDERVKGSLKIIKSDLNTGTTLKDAYMEIYKDNELIYSGYTNEFGIIELNNLGVGTYKIIERVAPQGYILNEEEYQVNLSNQTPDILVEIKNKHEEIEVPNTSLNQNKKLKYLSIGLFIWGFKILLLRKKLS